jgi:hypothetical protein
MTPATLPQVLDWADNPGAVAEFSPFSGNPCLLLDADGAGLPAAVRERIAQWLRQLPCPSIGVMRSGITSAISQACDVIVGSQQEAGPLLSGIGQNPIAAGVLVQTLRLAEQLPMMEALDVESLAYATLQGGAEFRRWLQANKADAPAVPTDAGPAVVIEREGDTLSLELNRASNRNAINVEMRDALVEALQLVIADDSVRNVRITGRGKCFSVGGDLTEFGTLPDPASAHAIRSLTMPGRFLAACAERVEFHVHGACIGSGVELPAFGRRVTAAKDTFFHMPELGFGLLPGGGGCVSIPRRIGRQRTAWWVLSGRRINAQKALEWGLIDAVVP